MNQKPASNSSKQQRTFKRAVWKRFLRYLGLAVIVMFNYMLIMGNIRLSQLHRLDLPHALLSYAMLVMLDIIFALPAVLEADRVIVTDDALVVGTIFWQVRLPWQAIDSCQKPAWLAYAIVRTKHFFYLISKRDIANFQELMDIIQNHMQMSKNEHTK